MAKIRLDGHMTTQYKHTQPGYVTAAATGAGALYAGGKLILAASKLPYLAAATVLGGVGLLFSSLTIKIAGGKLRSYFVAGLPAKTVDLDDIKSVDVVTNPWYYGWGIRYTPHGWLYNVSGFEAVEVRLKDGTQFRLGTDEPEELQKAIMKAKQMQP